MGSLPHPASVVGRATGRAAGSVSTPGTDEAPLRTLLRIPPGAAPRTLLRTAPRTLLRTAPRTAPRTLLRIPPRATILILAMCLAATAARAQVSVFHEDFDGVTAPNAPAGWTFGAGWETSTSSASPGSGANNLMVRGNSASGARTPAFSLSGATSGTLTYLARRTNSFDRANLMVRGSIDGGATFPVVVVDTVDALPAAGGSYWSVAAELPEALLGSANVVLLFQGRGLNASSANARLDDVTVSANLPLEVTPQTVTFMAAVGASEARVVTATNRTDGPLVIQPPSVTGTAFSVAPAQSILLDTGASQGYTVTFSPPQDGTFEGTLALDHDAGTATVGLTGSSSGGKLGFSSATSTVTEGEDGLEVALSLAVSASPGLQGLQFRMTWGGGLLSVDGVTRGTAVESAPDWMLTHEAGAGYVDVLLVSSGTTGLTPGEYDPVLAITFAVGLIGETDAQSLSLTLSDVIGALATPESGDARIGLGTTSHHVTVHRRRAVFSASTSAVEFGSTPAGESATREVDVTNAGGTTDLVITSVTRSNPLFAVSPEAASVSPEGRQTFTVTFAPTALYFGRQVGSLTFLHNGEGASSVVLLTGKGHGGRGDAEGDGIVDVLDVVHAIDFVLGRLTPDVRQAAAVDLFPFPDGDGLLDVRDVTVLSQGIARGRWPDDVSLPIVEADPGKGPGGLAHPLATNQEGAHLGPAARSGDRAAASTPAGHARLPASTPAGHARLLASIPAGYARLLASTQGDVTTLEVRHDMPIRGLQIVVQADHEMAVESDAPMVLFAGYDGTRRELRMLMYRADGEPVPPGVRHLVVHGRVTEPTYTAVVGTDRRHVPVVTAIATDEDPRDAEVPSLGPPYPNPFRPGSEAILHVPVGGGVSRHEADVAVFDVLGRIVFEARLRAGDRGVEWDGRDVSGRFVPPGLYVVSLRGEGMRTARPVVVLP